MYTACLFSGCLASLHAENCVNRAYVCVCVCVCVCLKVTHIPSTLLLLLLLLLEFFFFFTSVLMVFHWSLRDRKALRISRTLLSILADLNNAVVWMVSTRPLISKSSSPFINPLVTVPKAPITIGINIIFMFHSFFNSPARWRYSSFFGLSFDFTLWSAGRTKSTILQVSPFCCCWLL